MIGQVVLGKYRVTRLLDEGGMSKVYLARQANPDRDVVVKVLKESMLAVPRARQHFQREIHILSGFQHPHAVAYIDSSTRERQGPVLVMEYLRGADLDTLLERKSKFTPERVGRLLAQLCAVLEAAHDRGIVHRDLKPGNLMVLYPETPHETIKLMDFGLAKMTSLLFIAAEDMVNCTVPAAAGTPEYIPPEQVRGQDMDHRGDLYSLGVILFELLSGKRPFESADPEVLLRAHLDQEPPTLAQRGLAEPLPPGVEDLVRSLLAKSPDQRPQSAREVIDRYELALGRKFPRPGTGRLSGAVPRLSGTVPRLPAATPTPGRVRTVALAGPAKAEDRGVERQTVEVSMPESMVLLKVKGFIFDLGGEVVESAPGMIRVRLADPRAAKKGGLFGWFGGGKASTTELELLMERPDPSQPSRLTITLLMRPGQGQAAAEWQSRCQKVGRELQAYLVGR